MVHIELDTFSGRPNPRWSLTPAEAAELVARMRDERVAFRRPEDDEGILGYRGFIVTSDPDDRAEFARAGLPARFRLSATVAVPDSAALEFTLLDQAALRQVPPAVVQAAQASVTRISDSSCLQCQTTEATQLAACFHWVTSSTDYSFWNNNSHQSSNNCYNFASNWRTDTFAQPGRGTGTMWSSLTVPNITDAAIRDGYRTYCDGGNLYVALVIWPGNDYHWYVRTADLNGNWCFSHKPGTTAARHYDNSGVTITNPYTCNRGNYTTWGGYLYGPGTARTTVS